jgi:hypothetical protein
MELQPLESAQHLGHDPERQLLIVLGDLEILDRLPLGLDEFVRRGGSALIATDRESQQAVLSESFGIQFVHYPLRVPADSPAAYRKSRECIVVEGTQAGGSLFQNLTKVATNRPGFIEASGSKLQILAEFPKGTHGPIRPRFLFAVGGQYGEGRVLFLSDHSVFINAMLLQDDNDNYDFAKSCVRWLTDNRRREVLFIDEGAIEKSFDVPMSEPPFPPVESIVQAVDQGLRGLEEEDRFNEILLDVLDQMKAPRNRGEPAPVEMLLRVGFYVVTFGLVIFGLGLISQSRQRVESEGPAFAACLEQVSPRLEADEQRQRWLLRDGNYWETARALARHELEEWFGPEAPREPTRDLHFSGNWYERYWVRRRLRYLWRLAYQDRPRRINRNQLLRLGAIIDNLKKRMHRPDDL